MSVHGRENPPKVLIATTIHWASTTRLALAMVEAGINVAALAPSDHGLHRMDAIGERRIWSERSSFARAVLDACHAFRPNLIVPGDDRAVLALQALYRRHAGDPTSAIAQAIRASIGDPAFYPVAGRKSAFAAFCRIERLPLPETSLVADAATLRAALQTAGFPVVLKVDHSWGGLGVRVARSEDEALAALADLARGYGWRSSIRRAANGLTAEPLADRMRDGAPAITLQRYVPGLPANSALVCRAGEVLACLVVATVQVAHETGPSTVVRILDRPDIAAISARAVRRLGLSGFVGFDFVIDEATDRPMLIELNPRPTQTSHFAFDPASDLVGALAASLTGAPRRRLAERKVPELVALFPQEVWRDPSSRHFRAAYHDVPWSEPQFLSLYAKPVLAERQGWLTALRRRFRLGAVVAPARGATVMTEAPIE